VPIRMEVGPRDFTNKQCRLVRRDNGDKVDVAFDNVGSSVTSMLEDIHASLFAKAKAGRDEKIVQVTKWEDFVPALEKQCMILTPFCDLAEWEDKVKKMSREEALSGGVEAATTATSVAAKTLCKPFAQPDLPEGTPCFVSGLPAKTWVLWGRSY
jgi:prolyl-tRNA synthetase